MDWKTKHEGRARLRAWLPGVRAEIDRGEPFDMGGMSGAMKGLVPYIYEANFEALAIYRGPRGGWHADMLLKSTPQGVPNAFGTPKQRPCETKMEAETLGKMLLHVALVVSDKNREKEPGETPPPGFDLFDYAFDLIPEYLERASAKMPTEYTEERAIAFLKTTLAKYAPDGFTGEDFDRWSRDQQVELMTALHIMALAGLYRYPLNVDAPPKEQP